MTAGAAYTVGIDVGTTFTAAAIRREGKAEVVTLGDRGDVIPSIAFLREDDVLLVGHAAERRAVSDATRVARAFKRRIGDDVPLSLGGRAHTAEALTAAIVRWVVDLVTAREGGMPGRTVLTLPAGWRDHRRDLLLGAAAEAGVPEPELLAEPVAAAIHYSDRHTLPPGATVGIYDLGGGTFDATIVRRVDEGFEIVGRPQGDDRLGGIDLDALVWDHVGAVVGAYTLRPDGDPSPVQLRALAQVRAAAVDAKEALSYDTQAVVPVTLPGLMTEVRITRTEFEEMARPALLRTVDVFSRTCQAAHLAPTDLHAVLLVGGSSRIPMIGQLIGHELGARVVYDAHPKLATCLGAASAGSTDAWAPVAATQPPPPPPAGDDPGEDGPEPEADGTEPAGGRTEPEADGVWTRDGRGRRRALGVAALVTIVVAAVLGVVLTREQPGGVAAPRDERAATTTTTAAPTTSTTVAVTTTTTTADLAQGPTTPDDEAAQAIATSQPQSPATTTIPTTTTTPAPGSPCDPASGLPDCTDASADGTFRIVSGYADCVAAVGEDGGICTDLDGDGLAGYPDSG